MPPAKIAPSCGPNTYLPPQRQNPDEVDDTTALEGWHHRCGNEAREELLAHQKAAEEKEENLKTELQEMEKAATAQQEKMLKQRAALEEA